MGRLTLLLMVVAPMVLISQAGKFQNSYTMKISKGGKDYFERITVDTRKRTETSQVREASTGKDAGAIIYDFNRNLTMIRLPDAKSCFLSNSITENTPRPAEMIPFLRLVRSYASVTVNPQKKVTYKVDGKLTHRSGLSQEMADMCVNLPIHTIVRGASDQNDAANQMNDADRASTTVAPPTGGASSGGIEIKCHIVVSILGFRIFEVCITIPCCG